ncbi:uncharacterized protein LOC110737535 [Chenopodium quinoa]|uniref:uncharacterized protein LOC110737535 n=1 Tax=Chenopodium quinoa TaxID=63459 RepID=UPI000B78300E|nr:uncharacterized protein LOC110737535 [Chenopodium quinoa]
MHCKGIDVALTELWPKVGRRYCCKHLVKNFKAQFPGLLMFQLFWKAAGAYNPFTFRKAMEALQKANPESLVWLATVGPQATWFNAFNPAIKSDVNKSNFVESFNATLGIDRCRPVITLLEGVRRLTMVRMETRKEQCQSWRDDLCPNIIKRLQLSGLPCKHAMRAIYHKYVSEWYLVRRYKLNYRNNIKSIPDVEKWPNNTYPEINPPPIKRRISRPTRIRRREEGEQANGKRSKTIRCSKCVNFGHNMQTCQGGFTGKEKAARAAGQQKTKQPPKPKKGVSLSQPDPTTVASTSSQLELQREPGRVFPPPNQFRSLCIIRS